MKHIDISHNNILKKFISYFQIFSKGNEISEKYKKKLLEGLCQGLVIFYGIYTEKDDRKLTWNQFLATLATWEDSEAELKKDSLGLNFEITISNALFFHGVRDNFIEQKYPYGYSYKGGEKLLPEFNHHFNQINLFKPGNKYFSLLAKEIKFEVTIGGHFTLETLEDFFSLSDVFDLPSTKYEVECLNYSSGHAGGFRLKNSATEKQDNQWFFYPVNDSAGEIKFSTKSEFLLRLINLYGNDLIIRIVGSDERYESSARVLFEKYLKAVTNKPAIILTPPALYTIINRAPKLLNTILSINKKEDEREKIKQAIRDGLHDSNDKLLQYLYENKTETLNLIALQVPFFTMNFSCRGKTYTIACLKQKSPRLEKLQERVAKILGLKSKHINICKENGGPLNRHRLYKLYKKVSDDTSSASLHFNVESKIVDINICFKLKEKALQVDPLNKFSDVKLKVMRSFNLNPYYYDLVYYDQTGGTSNAMGYLKSESDFKNFLVKGDSRLYVQETKLFILSSINQAFWVRQDEITEFNDLVEKVKSNIHSSDFALFVGITDSEQKRITDKNFVPGGDFFSRCLSEGIIIEQKKVSVNVTYNDQSFVFDLYESEISLDMIQEKMNATLRQSSNAIAVDFSRCTLTLEMGGGRPMIIDADTDLKSCISDASSTNIKLTAWDFIKVKIFYKNKWHSINFNLGDSWQMLMNLIAKNLGVSQEKFSICNYSGAQKIPITQEQQFDPLREVCKASIKLGTKPKLKFLIMPTITIHFTFLGRQHEIKNINVTAPSLKGLSALVSKTIGLEPTAFDIYSSKAFYQDKGDDNDDDKWIFDDYDLGLVLTRDGLNSDFLNLDIKPKSNKKMASQYISSLSLFGNNNASDSLTDVDSDTDSEDDLATMMPRQHDDTYDDISDVKDFIPFCF